MSNELDLYLRNLQFQKLLKKVRKPTPSMYFATMKILVDHGGYEVKNMGDLAMLKIAVDRLQNIFPDAQVYVFTTNPHSLREHLQNVILLPVIGRDLWLSDLSPHVYGFLPNCWLVNKCIDAIDWLRYILPSVTYHLIRLKLRRNPGLVEEVKRFLDVTSGIDLFAVAGGGFITDEFDSHTAYILKTLRFFQKLGKPTVILGQGLGPLENPHLVSIAKQTLSNVDLISLRENRVGISLLKSLGVSEERIAVTGDDAIELAYAASKSETQNCIGVNLRVATYSGISESLLEKIKSVLHTFARQKNSPLIPVPIAHASHEGLMDADSVSIKKILSGYDNLSDGGEKLNTPLKVVEQVGRCRVVVTGSYHASVFALSQGIPVVCLAKSQYYIDKFRGLAEQFGSGCEVMLLDEEKVEGELPSLIQAAWHKSEYIKPELLRSARKQIDSGRAVYNQIPMLLSLRKSSLNRT